jgi:excisionase family DNA binding protein
MTKEIIILDKNELTEILQKYHQELKNLLQSQAKQKDELISSKDVPAYLGISRKTWQTYRDRKLIPFSQTGRKIWVRRSDLDAFVNSYRIDNI